MVRNAGGRVVDVIKTLAVLQTIGAPGTIAVMHHTGTFPPDIAHGARNGSLTGSKTAVLPISTTRRSRRHCSR
jgi:hypothetical protein